MILSFLLACRPEPTDSPADNADDSSGPEIGDLDPSVLPAGDTPCREPVLAHVEYLADGDTARVGIIGGAGETIRFIGINSPEIAHDDPAECYGDEAKVFTEGLLDGKSVWLTFDNECTDHYDRTLAYLHLGAGPDDFVNRKIVREGAAFAYPFNPNTQFEQEIAQDEASAKAAGKGLWGACGG